MHAFYKIIWLKVGATVMLENDTQSIKSRAEINVGGLFRKLKINLFFLIENSPSFLFFRSSHFPSCSEMRTVGLERRNYKHGIPSPSDDSAFKRFFFYVDKSIFSSQKEIHVT
jgi:hypothetical protein